jgi:hypothetical protein
VHYQQLWLQQITDPSYQPLRFSDYFQQFKAPMNFINKMTKKNIEG